MSVATFAILQETPSVSAIHSQIPSMLYRNHIQHGCNHCPNPFFFHTSQFAKFCNASIEVMIIELETSCAA